MNEGNGWKREVRLTFEGGDEIWISFEGNGDVEVLPCERKRGSAGGEFKDSFLSNGKGSPSGLCRGEACTLADLFRRRRLFRGRLGENYLTALHVGIDGVAVDVAGDDDSEGVGR